MRIAHLIFGLGVGGAETMLADIVREHSLTEEVFLIVINADCHKSVLGSLNDRARVIELGRPVSSRNPWYAVKLRHVLRQIKPDIVHSHSTRAIDLMPFLHTPIVATIHATRAELKRSVRRYRRLFAISDAVRNDVINRYPDLDLAVVHNGVRFSSIRQKGKAGPDNGPFRVVQVGRLDHRVKGQDITLRALRHVSDRLGEGTCTVDFIGEGESRAFLESLAQELGVRRQCGFLGLLTRQKTYDALSAYDLLVQPSRYEGFGLTVVEGMAAKIPVLVSDTEGPMEIIDGGRYGFCFQTEDFLNCGERIIEIVDLSREQGFEESVNEAYQYARDRFDVSVTARKYIEEYEKLLSGR